MTNSRFLECDYDPATLVKAIPYVAKVIRDEPLLFDDAKDLLVSVFPEWRDDKIALKQSQDGITNKLVMCTNEDTKKTVLIRAYGKRTEVIIDRSKELLNMAGLAHLGMCPPIYARFENGLVYGFISGTVAKSEEMGSDLWAPLIAQAVARWSQINLPGDHSPQLFPCIRRWMADVPEKYENPKANATFRSYFSMEKLATEATELEATLFKLNSPVVFAHNDLLSGNIIISESKDKVSFIDYEYGMYNYRAFDIANHFNEYAGFECDYSRYPTKQVQLKWFKVYLDTIDQDSSPEALEAMYKEVSFFQLASHFYWGVWALVQAAISDIDFDYMEYAKMRFDQYYKVKAQILN
ncbi:hypothetical protein GGI25_004101 [Coemansia spiralis]|uniref:ethanolamine kinase n=2 Tax=Coemansia TaxID=4863 RepID=A0A9W8G774_9FUNG|nr:kinase-like domain-containing protein [Coemansia spiralis]KAJ1990638.1 hypothetical protein EDC05_003953 [Coemansia umbellata]KAJ2622385.1 hypothetical protein GGI26_003248 [Coemansia sp. RSA 1358]KAJ2675052.1 hypothetical protein GGI25_004101 [Coemansia spiralis]